MQNCKLNWVNIRDLRLPTREDGDDVGDDDDDDDDDNDDDDDEVDAIPSSLANVSFNVYGVRLIFAAVTAS